MDSPILVNNKSNEGTMFYCIILIIVIGLIILSIFYKDGFETIENNYNDLNPIDLTSNIINNEPLENNMQSQNLVHNEILGFNNNLNQYSLLQNMAIQQPVVTTSNMNMDLVNIDQFNQQDMLNSFINAQLTDKQAIQDNEDYEMTQLRNNNNQKYADIYAWSNQNPINIETSVDKINAIRTSDGIEKFSNYGNTIWEAYDNLMK
jgi:hypothetical protein